ncbi:MAG: hypothetical protein ACP5KN_04430 [Armatimonadota bacterium]
MTLALATMGMIAAMLTTAAPEPFDVGVHRQLFVDGSIVSDFHGDARLRMHEPTRREVALACDEPWEGATCGYFTVFKDDSLYRMYYRGSDVVYEDGNVNWEPHPMVTCYAHSVDGVHWTKPELGLHEFNGSRANNIIWTGAAAHNFTPFRDANPDCASDARYKAVGSAGGGLHAFKSPDGIRWEALQGDPIITEGAFDSQNLAFWDQTIRKYRAYWRDFHGEGEIAPPGRDVKTATSEDFINWSEPRWLVYTPGRRGTDESTPPHHQFYTNGVLPYYRAPQVLLGFPTRYIDRGWGASTDHLPQLEDRRERSAASVREGTALTDGMFMVSRDGRNFFVWPEAFIRPGIQRLGSWTYGDNYQAWGMVETPSDLPGAPNEISVYATENYQHAGPMRLRRFTIRVDGFASAHASLHGGDVVTRPLIFDGSTLEINFATSAGGSVKVELQSADGEPIEGYTSSDCAEILGDELSRTVQWGERADVSPLAGQPVRIRFELRDADVYSFRFAGDGGVVWRSRLMAGTDWSGCGVGPGRRAGGSYHGGLT